MTTEKELPLPDMTNYLSNLEDAAATLEKFIMRVRELYVVGESDPMTAEFKSADYTRSIAENRLAELVRPQSIKDLMRYVRQLEKENKTLQSGRCA